MFAFPFILLLFHLQGVCWLCRILVATLTELLGLAGRQLLAVLPWFEHLEHLACYPNVRIYMRLSSRSFKCTPKTWWCKTCGRVEKIVRLPDSTAKSLCGGVPPLRESQSSRRLWCGLLCTWVRYTAGLQAPPHPRGAASSPQRAG